MRDKLGALLSRPGIWLGGVSWISPNMLSLTGFALSLLAGVFIFFGHLRWGGALVLFSGLFDLWDGALARSKGKTSQFGAILDSFLDRLSEAILFLSILLSLLLISPSHGTPLAVYFPLLFLALSGSFLTSYLRARGEGVGIRASGGLFTRPERITALGVGLLFSYRGLLASLALITLLGWFTVFQRLIILQRACRPGSLGGNSGKG